MFIQHLRLLPLPLVVVSVASVLFHVVPAVIAVPVFWVATTWVSFMFIFVICFPRHGLKMHASPHL